MYTHTHTHTHTHKCPPPPIPSHTHTCTMYDTGMKWTVQLQLQWVGRTELEHLLLITKNRAHPSWYVCMSLCMCVWWAGYICLTQHICDTRVFCIVVIVVNNCKALRALFRKSALKIPPPPKKKINILKGKPQWNQNRMVLSGIENKWVSPVQECWQW